MKIGDIDPLQLGQALNEQGLVLRCGEFLARITSPFTAVSQGLRRLYADHELVEETALVDCDVRILPSRGLHRFRREPVRLVVNGKDWYRAGRSLEYACLEWGINWFIFRTAHHRLVIHAGCLERDGVGLVLPGLPGSGKSTLTAALAHSGWRLFSDELTIINPETRKLCALARPVCLKGESIPVIQRFAPNAIFGPRGFDRKEHRPIAHVKPPEEAVRRMRESATPRLVIYPKYVRDAPTQLTPISKAKSLIDLAQSSFNYSTLRRLGFETLTSLMKNIESYQLSYSDLNEAVEQINELVGKQDVVAAHG